MKRALIFLATWPGCCWPVCSMIRLSCALPLAQHATNVLPPNWPQITGEDIEQYGQEIFAAAAADLNARSAETLITCRLQRIYRKRHKVCHWHSRNGQSGVHRETYHRNYCTTMQQLSHERGYTSFLFMIVDIINMQLPLIIWGGEQAVAEVLGAPLEEDGHTVVVEELVSRKKQLVPLLGTHSGRNVRKNRRFVTAVRISTGYYFVHVMTVHLCVADFVTQYTCHRTNTMLN